jgi:hypothetical protein
VKYGLGETRTQREEKNTCVYEGEVNNLGYCITRRPVFYADVLVEWCNILLQWEVHVPRFEERIT